MKRGRKNTFAHAGVMGRQGVDDMVITVRLRGSALAREALFCVTVLELLNVCWGERVVLGLVGLD